MTPPPHRHAPDPHPSLPARGSRRRSAWNWLLVIPALALCFPALYARSTPSLLGWPFFYWYQFAWIVLSGAITAVVYFATR